MADVFISYARDDRPRAKLLAEAIQKQGYSVWWDFEIVPGKRFSKAIEKALDEVKCVIVLWSKKSVESEWVEAEAAEGKQQNKLVPAMIENVTIPLAFRQIHTADLINWEKDKPHAEFNSLMAAIKEIVGEPSVGETEDDLEVDKEDQEEVLPSEDRLGYEGPQEPKGRFTPAIVVSIGLALLLLVGLVVIPRLISPPTPTSQTPAEQPLSVESATSPDAGPQSTPESLPRNQNMRKVEGWIYLGKYDFSKKRWAETTVNSKKIPKRGDTVTLVGDVHFRDNKPTGLFYRKGNLLNPTALTAGTVVVVKEVEEKVGPRNYSWAKVEVSVPR